MNDVYIDEKPLDHPGEDGLARDASIFSRRENMRKSRQPGREVSGRHSLDARRGTQVNDDDGNEVQSSQSADLYRDQPGSPHEDTSA